MTEEIHPRRRRCRLRRGGRQDLPRSSKRPLGRVPPPQVPPLIKGVLISPSPKFPRVCVWQGEASVPSVSRVWLLGNGRNSQTSPPFLWPGRFQTRKGNWGGGGPSASIMHALPAISVAIILKSRPPSSQPRLPLDPLIVGGLNSGFLLCPVPPPFPTTTLLPAPG